MANKHRGNPKTRVGVVVSDKMQKTVVVEVRTTVLQNRYKKFIHRVKQFKAHDETGSCHVGDRVEIIESRPISKTKSWRVRKVLERVTK